MKGELQKLKFADLQEVRRIGDLGLLLVFVVVGLDQGFKKGHITLFPRLSA